MSYQTINPANGEVLQSFADISNAALENVLVRAAHAYEAWRHKSYADRAMILNKGLSA